MRRLVLAMLLSGFVGTADAAPPDERVAALRERAVFERFATALEQNGEPRALLLAAQLAAGGVRYDAHNERRGRPLSMPLAERLERQRRADALIDRLWDADSRDALVLYELVAECPGTPAVCRSDEALAALRSSEPDNAFVWLLQLDLEPASGAAPPPIAREDLLRAATSTRYDDYLTRHGASLIDLHATLSPDDARQLFLDDETLAGVSGSPPMPREDVVRAVLAFGRWLAVGAPITRLSSACPREQVGADETLRSACLAIGRLVLRDADTSIALTIAESVVHRSSADPAEQAAVLQRRRTRVWRQERDAELWTDLPNAGLDATWLADWRRSGEPGAQRARLERAGIATEPPAQWMPRTPEQVELR